MWEVSRMNERNRLVCKLLPSNNPIPLPLPQHYVSALIIFLSCCGTIKIFIKNYFQVTTWRIGEARKPLQELSLLITVWFISLGRLVIILGNRCEKWKQKTETPFEYFFCAQHLHLHNWILKSSYIDHLKNNAVYKCAFSEHFTKHILGIPLRQSIHAQNTGEARQIMHAAGSNVF